MGFTVTQREAFHVPRTLISWLQVPRTTRLIMVCQSGGYLMDDLKYGTRNKRGDESAFGTQAYAHTLHHKYFELNYSDGLMPFDRWFGT